MSRNLTIAAIVIAALLFTAWSSAFIIDEA